MNFNYYNICNKIYIYIHIAKDSKNKSKLNRKEPIEICN